MMVITAMVIEKDEGAAKATTMRAIQSMSRIAAMMRTWMMMSALMITATSTAMVMVMLLMCMVYAFIVRTMWIMSITIRLL